ncbi:MAG: arabinan endo-1,5-alpha-L-arabinosidase [Asticcacaulis sp.]
MQAFPDWVMEKLPGTKGAWAPDISYVNGKYLLYYAASLFGKNTSVIGLMTTPTLDIASPDFGWQDEGLVIESVAGDDFNAIDPNHIVDGRGRHWLALGSFWNGLKLIELDPATNKPKAGAKRIALAQRPRPDAVEGAFLIRRGEYYYLFASYDFCCRGVNSSYYTVVGRARSIKGPYIDRDGPQDAQRRRRHSYLKRRRRSVRTMEGAGPLRCPAGLRCRLYRLSRL